MGKVSFYKILAIKSLLLFTFSIAYGATGPDLKKGGPIHEAFVAPFHGTVVLEAIDQAPPERLVEKIPEPPNPQAEWITGYWAWSKEQNAHVWVCGVWRVPPPGLRWNSGFWSKFSEGWVWLEGFWSTTAAQNITPIKKPPPDQIDENIPALGDPNKFWMSGHWRYDANAQKYEWAPGSWVDADPDWVLTPATYLWRENGYLFIPAYWDYPLEERGDAYCSLGTAQDIPPGEMVLPSDILPPETIIGILFPYWPDYDCFFWHWWHFHPDYWDGWCCDPPWWGWGNWWGLGWSYQWDLWWWWCHPGFPHPFWITLSMNGMIVPPGGIILGFMGGIFPPIIIGPNGVFPLNALLDTIEEVTKSKHPILPADPKIKQEIISKIVPIPSELGDKRPSGKEGDQAPVKPWIKPMDDVSVTTPADVPSTPSTPEFRPPIQKPEYAPPPPRRMKPADHYFKPRPVPPRYPDSQRPPRYPDYPDTQPPPQRDPGYPEFRPPQRRPIPDWRPPRRPTPPKPPSYEPDYVPPSRYPQPPSNNDQDFVPPSRYPQPPSNNNQEFAPPSRYPQPPSNNNQEFAPPSRYPQPPSNIDRQFAPPSQTAPPPSSRYPKSEIGAMRHIQHPRYEQVIDNHTLVRRAMNQQMNESHRHPPGANEMQSDD